jgi:hypothetical protein
LDCFLWIIFVQKGIILSVQCVWCLWSN